MKKIFFMLACTVGVLTMQAETFIKVTDAATLQDGDKVVMGCAAKGEVSAGFSSTYKYLDGVTATFQDDKATVENPKVITLKKNGSYWNLYLGSKVIGHNSGSSDLDGQKCRYTTNFAISFEANGTANIVSQTPGDKNAEVFFNHHTTNSRFSLYKASSNQLPIELYKLDESTIPDVVVTSVTLNKNSLDLRMGTTETLTATVLPNDAVDKTIAWGTTDATVATVANGVVTPVAEGTAKIWVKATAVENVSDTCVVTVLPKTAEGNATYNAVQSAEYLPEGAIVFIGTVKSGENYVMGQYVSGNNIKGTAATYGDERHSVTAPKQVAYTVHIENGKYVFVDHDGLYLICNGEKKLISSSTKDSKAQWTLGAFDEDDASVTLTNAYYTSYGIFNNWQGTNDMFSAYGGVGDGSNLAKIVLYSDKAPEWVAPVKDPWMQVESTIIDWGKVEPVEGYTNYWSEAKYVKLTMNDLPANIDVELTNDANGAFTCYTSTISSSKASEQFLVSWSVEQAGKYEGELTLSCAGLETIKIKLIAEAVAKGQGGENPGEEDKPELIVSANHIYLNPTTGAETSSSDNFMSAEYTFTFSAKNLAKDLRMKWWRDTYNGTWFPWNTEKMEMWMAYEPMNYIYEPMTINDNINLGKDDITDFEVYIALNGIQNNGTYYSELQFTSYKEGSKTELAINKVIPIKVIVSPLPTPDPDDTATGIEDVQRDKVQCTKVLKDGVLYLMYKGTMYNVQGQVVSDK